MAVAILEAIRRGKDAVYAEAEGIGFAWRPTLIVAWGALAMVVPHYHRGEWYWNLVTRLGGPKVTDYLRYVWVDLSFLLQFGGALLLILLMREPLKSYGLGLGKVKLGLKICLLFYVLYAPLFVIFFASSGFQEHYGVITKNITSWPQFWWKEGPAVFFFMLKTEFFFRGFLLFGIKKRYGAYAAILLTMIPFVLVHLVKPEIETFGAFPVGLALAYLAIRTESIWYGFLLHWSLALSLNGLVLVFNAP